jgi:penicillin G amidase
MRRTLKILKWFVIIVVILVVIVVGAGYFYLRQSLPQMEGSIKVTGLSAAVEIIRDIDAVPHIYAQNKLDAYWGLGYLHAQDRLWQMGLQRRVLQGRLAQLFGPSLISQDHFLRALGVYRAAQSAWESLPSEPKQIINAYVAGINAFVATHNGSQLPPEYKIVGISPETWSGADVLAWIKMVAYNLDSLSFSTETLANDLFKTVGPQKAQQLMPAYPEDGPAFAQAHNSTQAYSRLVEISERVSEYTGFISIDMVGLGSNSWVVDGIKSATGRPFLANDPHLALSAPSTWYLAHLSANDLDVIGATIPGLPMIIIGRNRSIAWGITHLSSDVQDLYRERIDSTGSLAEFQGRMEPMRLITETIKVKGGADAERTVRITRHGPLISDVVGSTDSVPRGEQPQASAEPLALAWAALQPEDTTVKTFLGISEARNWDEFKRSLRECVAPALSFVYADVEGNIGYHVAGRIPIRSNGNGSLPAEGWTGANEWSGWIPFEKLPQVYDPPEHFIVTANNRPVAGNDSYFLGRQWQPAYRAQRIAQLLESKDKVSPEDHATIQCDTVSLQSRELIPLLLNLVTAQDESERHAIELLKGWDGDAHGDSAAAAIYESWLARLPRAICGDEVGPELISRYENRFDYVSRFLLYAAANPNSEWWDDVTTPDRETCSSVLSNTLRQALSDLKANLGERMESWRWDKIHRVIFPHHPFHNIGLLRGFFSRSAPHGGDRSTVNVGLFGGQSFEQLVGPGYRQLIDLSNSQEGRFIMAIGMSGHFLSSHYDDYLTDWKEGRYRPLRFDSAAVEANREFTLRLEP